MGNDIKLPQNINNLRKQIANQVQAQLSPKTISIHQKIILINQTFQQYKQHLGMQIFIQSIKNQQIRQLNDKKIKIYGKIILMNKKLLDQGQNMNKQKMQRSINFRNIMFTYEDINNVYNYVKNLQLSSKKQKKQNRLQQKQQYKQQQKFNKLTPTPTPTPQFCSSLQSQQCCICLNKLPSMALPCLHMFCDDCTIKYIIQVQQKKCPQCRKQFKGSRQSIEKQIYTIIQEDEEVYQEIKQHILHILKQTNKEIVESLIQQQVQEEQIGKRIK